MIKRNYVMDKKEEKSNIQTDKVDRALFKISDGKDKNNVDQLNERRHKASLRFVKDSQDKYVKRFVEFYWKNLDLLEAGGDINKVSPYNGMLYDF